MTAQLISAHDTSEGRIFYIRTCDGVRVYRQTSQDVLELLT